MDFSTELLRISLERKHKRHGYILRGGRNTPETRAAPADVAHRPLLRPAPYTQVDTANSSRHCSPFGSTWDPRILPKVALQPALLIKLSWHEEKVSAIPAADPWFITNRRNRDKTRGQHIFS